MRQLLLMTLTLGLCAGIAFAHNGMVHVMGTVTAITGTSISVRATDGTVQNVALTSETKYLRGVAAVSLKDIKIGDRIVIHATGKADHLVAAEVKAATMKGMSDDMKMSVPSQSRP
jgi:hypothetical protein